MVTAEIFRFKENSHGRAGNRTRDLMISSQRLWPLDHEAGQEDWSRKHLMKGEALLMNLRNLLEEKVLRPSETVRTVCDERIVQMKNRIVYKINFGLPQCFPFRILTIWRNRSAPKNYLIFSHGVLVFEFFFFNGVVFLYWKSHCTTQCRWLFQCRVFTCRKHS